MASPIHGYAASSVLGSAYPLQNPTAGGISLGSLPLTQLILGGANGTTDAQVAVSLLKGQNAYEQSSTDKPGSALILSGGIGRRFITIVDATLIDAAADTITLTLGSISTGSYVSTATVITAGTGWTDFSTNNACAADLATYINTLGLSLTATAASGVVYLAPKPDLVSFLLQTSMAAGEGTVTQGTDGPIRIFGGSIGGSAPQLYFMPNFGVGVAFGMVNGGGQLGVYTGDTGVASVALAPSNITFGSNALLQWTNATNNPYTTIDVALARLGTASLRMGQAPSATPVAQTFTLGEASRPGTDTNVGGASGTIRPGLGTGTGTASSLILQGVVVTGGGSGVQSYQDMIKISGVSLGFYNTTPVAQQTGVAVSAAGIHAACVALGLFTA